MNNLIIAWKELTQKNNISIAEGVRHLNSVCGTKITPSCIIEMAKGKKAVPASVNRYMLSEVLSNEFKVAKFKMNNIDFGILLNNISIPARIK